jgi:integrase
MCAQISALTPAAIVAAMRAGEVHELNDAGEPGLCLRIGSRSATWSWRGRDAQGRVRRFGLGRYPNIGLAEARRRARAMADEVRRGADPVAQARARRAAQKQPTGATLADLFAIYAKRVGAGVKSWSVMERHARRVFKAHLEVPLANLTLGAMQMTVDEYAPPGSAAHGVRCILPMLRWAAAPGRGYVSRDLLDLRTSTPRPVRDRVLSRAELHAILPVLRERAATDVYALALHFILLTAARRSEVARARWRDVDLEAARAWIIPEAKNKQPHTVPLSRQTLTLLRSRIEVLTDLGLEPAPDALVFTTTTLTGAPLSRWEEATRRVQALSSTSNWTRHDLRRTAATLMGELGVQPAIVEACLNHVTIHSAIAAVYNRSRYRPEVGKALQQLADLLDSIEQGGAEIVALRASNDM